VCDWLNKLMIVMAELGKLVVLKRRVLVVQPLEICDIGGGELLLVEGGVGHAALA
jgi:hypothetical protein